MSIIYQLPKYRKHFRYKKFISASKNISKRWFKPFESGQRIFHFFLFITTFSHFFEFFKGQSADSIETILIYHSWNLITNSIPTNRLYLSCRMKYLSNSFLLAFLQTQTFSGNNTRFLNATDKEFANFIHSFIPNPHTHFHLDRIPWINLNFNSNFLFDFPLGTLGSLFPFMNLALRKPIDFIFGLYK